MVEKSLFQFGYKIGGRRKPRIDEEHLPYDLQSEHAMEHLSSGKFIITIPFSKCLVVVVEINHKK